MTTHTLTPDEVRSLAASGRSTALLLQSFAVELERARASFDASLELWRVRANTLEEVAGLEGRYHARAALNPAYTGSAQIDYLVRSILSGQAPGTILLLPEHRAAVAAAALRGWTQTHHDPVRPEGLSWARALGTTHILVTREAAA